MATATEIILLAALGAALGAFYFGGLWLTVKRMHRTDRPALLMLGSFMGRMALSLPVFYLVVRGGNWERLLVVTAAFLTVRMILILRLGPRRQTETITTLER